MTTLKCCYLFPIRSPTQLPPTPLCSIDAPLDVAHAPCPSTPTDRVPETATALSGLWAAQATHSYQPPQLNVSAGACSDQIVALGIALTLTQAVIRNRTLPKSNKKKAWRHAKSRLVGLPPCYNRELEHCVPSVPTTVKCCSSRPAKDIPNQHVSPISKCAYSTADR